MPEDPLSIAEHPGASIGFIEDAQRAEWAQLGLGWRRGTFAISGTWFEDAQSYVLLLRFAGVAPRSAPEIFRAAHLPGGRQGDRPNHHRISGCRQPTG